MSHSAENFRRGISLFLYLRKLSASESFMDKKRVSRFFVENFSSHSAEKFVVIPSMFQKNWGIEKFYAQ